MSLQDKPFAGFAFLFLGSTVGAINYQAPAVIFDAVSRDLQMSAAAATYVQTLFFACLGASLILAGSLGDEIGKRKLCLIGLVTMMVGLLVSGWAPNAALLLFGRAVQGMGMAAFLSTMVALCSSLFPDPRQKSLAFSLFGASVGIAVTIGDLFGAYMLRTLSWRWTFLALEPLFLIVFLGVLIVLRERTVTTEAIRFDAFGALWLCLGLMSLIFALSEGSTYGWLFQKRSWLGLDLRLAPSLWLAMITAVSMWMLNRHELGRIERGEYVALDYSLFQSKAFSRGIVTTALYFAGALGVSEIWPSFLVHHLRSITAMDLAVVMSGMGVAFTLASLLSSALASKIGVKAVVIGGIATNIGAMLVLLTFIRLTKTVTPVQLSAILIVFGAGYGLVFTKLTYLVIADIPPDHSSSASGILLSARQASAGIGAAILVALIQGAGSLMAVNGVALLLIVFSLIAAFFLPEPTLRS